MSPWVLMDERSAIGSASMAPVVEKGLIQPFEFIGRPCWVRTSDQRIMSLSGSLEESTSWLHFCSAKTV